jgi:hypothetical protein
MLTTSQLPVKGPADVNADKREIAPLSSDGRNQEHTVTDSGLDQLTAEPAHDAVAVLAYSYWLAREDSEGSAEEDWAHAERTLRAQNVAGFAFGGRDGHSAT